MKYSGITRNLWAALSILPSTLLSLLCDDLAQAMWDCVKKGPVFRPLVCLASSTDVCLLRRMHLRGAKWERKTFHQSCLELPCPSGLSLCNCWTVTCESLPALWELGKRLKPLAPPLQCRFLSTCLPLRTPLHPPGWLHFGACHSQWNRCSVSLSVTPLECVPLSDILLSVRPTVVLSPGILPEGHGGQRHVAARERWWREGKGTSRRRRQKKWTNHFASAFYSIVFPCWKHSHSQ